MWAPDAAQRAPLAAGCAADPGPVVSLWGRSLRSSVKNAAPRPGHVALHAFRTTGDRTTGDGVYLSRVTVEAGSMPGSSMSAEDLGIASITSMPRVWQMLAR